VVSKVKKIVRAWSAILKDEDLSERVGEDPHTLVPEGIKEMIRYQEELLEEKRSLIREKRELAVLKKTDPVAYAQKMKEKAERE